MHCFNVTALIKHRTQIIKIKLEMINKIENTTYTTTDQSSSHPELDQRLIEVIDNLNVNSILDVGCGAGFLSNQLADKGYEVVACDPEQSALDLAGGQSKVSFNLLGCYDDPSKLDVSNIDLVLSSEVIEHLVLPRKLIDFSGYFLKKNGLLVLSTPYYGSYIKNLICSLCNKWDDQFAVLWDGGHIKFWSLKTLTILLKEGGFELVEYKTSSKHPWPFRLVWPNNIIVVAQKK